MAILLARMLEGINLSRLWSAVLGDIEVSLSDGAFNAWFKSTRLLSLDEEVVEIGVINIFAKRQLEDKFKKIIVAAFGRQNYKVEEIVYTIVKPEAKSADTGLFENTPTTDSFSEPIGVMGPPSGGLNPKYTFKNFIVGSGTELAYAACQAVAKDPGSKYNPLFIYGDVGLGKTHLVQAVGNEIKRTRPGAKILYLSSEKFINEFVDSIRFKRVLSKKYRNADVLIVDDMQFIAGKEKTQIEFFHTFNELHQANKQIILSSDRPPKSIPTLEDRLRSRFEWGMTIDIQAPDFETRCAILQSKASESGVDLPIDVAEFLASKQQENIRELEGTLNQFLAQCELLNQSPTLGVAEQMFASLGVPKKRLTSRAIIENTARHFQIDSKLVLGSTRKKEVVLPRQVAMFLLREELHYSFPQIADSLGRKDHTTAIHSINKIADLLQQDASLRSSLQKIRESLYES